MGRAAKIIEAIDQAVREGNAGLNCVTYVRELAEIVDVIEQRKPAAAAPPKARSTKRGV